jgi:hypothetical protein
LGSRIIFCTVNILLRLRDQFDKTADFGFRPAFHYLGKCLLRDIFPQKGDNIEGFPPAVDDFPAWIPRLTASSAVFEGDRPTQSGASTL